MASSLFPASAVPVATPTANKPQINMAAIGQIKQMMGAVSAMQNPMRALQVMSGQIPVLGQVLQLCQGRNPRDVFYEECKKVGANPDEVLSYLR